MDVQTTSYHHPYKSLYQARQNHLIMNPWLAALPYLSAKFSSLPGSRIQEFT